MGDEMIDRSKRSDVHGEKGATSTGMNGPDLTTVHCCECWKYTDDKHYQAELDRSAVSIINNSSTLAVEKSKAFEAADAYLATRFKDHTPLAAPRF